MVMEWKLGQIALSMKDSIKKDRRKDKGNTNGQMGVSMKDNGNVIKLVDLGNIVGLMEEK